ncbi:hypothetical protein ACHAWF_015068 [Thalassiosira exigua]
MPTSTRLMVSGAAPVGESDCNAETLRRRSPPPSTSNNGGRRGAVKCDTTTCTKSLRSLAKGPSSRKRRRASISHATMSSSNVASLTLLVASLLLSSLAVARAQSANCVNDINVCDGEGEPFRPLPQCREYARCEGGKLAEIKNCGAGSIFDVLLKRCNFEDASFCIVQSCRPTPPPTQAPTSTPSDSPSGEPSAIPTDSPSSVPSASPTASPSAEPSAPPTNFPTYDFFSGLETVDMRKKIEDTVLQSYNPSGIAYASTKYLYEGLISALREMIMGGIYSDGRTFTFYTSQFRLDYGWTNLALFLANAMTESIAYDTCDEFNTDEVADRYALSNSCGQNARSYQDEACRNEERHMSCPVDPNMKMVSTGYSTEMLGRAPPPFSCGPKEHFYDYAGYWDAQTGQSSQTAYSNARGRTDVQGCCWWGRGSLLTRGVCKIIRPST